MIQNFYFKEGIFDYGFGDTHPLKPERLRRMFRLLDTYAHDYATHAELATREDLLRVHSAEYVDGTRYVSNRIDQEASEKLDDLRTEYGFWGDNPATPGMYEAALACSGAATAAARCVLDGASLSFSIGGGWHHALAGRASGFCIFNDCAIACSILREKYDRVAYVDIDVHHGDGVQWIFYKDPSVLTCSIHEEGRTLWPGTGGVEETGANYSSFNVPIQAGTTSDVWLNAFQQTVLPALKAWKAEAIVLQTGTDTHYLDPLAHINSDQSAWLQAILNVRDLGLPTVVLGGGGYNLTTVPRMWVSSILTLSGISFEDQIPESLVGYLGVKTFSDVEYPYRSTGGEHAERVIRHLIGNHIPHLVTR